LHIRIFYRIAAVCGLLVGQAMPLHAQMDNSVYSIFGLGELVDNNIGVNRSLGGTGIAFQSGTAINYLNPASYLGITSHAFMMEVGAYSIYNDAAKGNLARTHRNIDLSYGSLGAYLTDGWTLSAGVLPFSHIGYGVTTTVPVDGDRSSYDKTITGSGSIKRAYIGNAVRIMDGLAAGVDLCYVGGSIKESETSSGNADLAGYEINNTLSLQTWYLGYGVQYTRMLDNVAYTAGLVYSGAAAFDASDDQTLTSNGTTTAFAHAARATMKVPRRVGFGLAAKASRFRAGIDYEWQNWADVKFADVRARTRNSNRYAVGFEYFVPRSDPQAAPVSYRCGANYRSSYLEVGSASVNAYALTIGVGIPLRGLTLSVSVEYGEEGTLDKGLVRNRYGMVYASVNVFEVWRSLDLDD
jgi:hypothetical protein